MLLGESVRGMLNHLHRLCFNCEPRGPQIVLINLALTANQETSLRWQSIRVLAGWLWMNCDCWTLFRCQLNHHSNFTDKRQKCPFLAQLIGPKIPKAGHTVERFCCFRFWTENARRADFQLRFAAKRDWTLDVSCSQEAAPWISRSSSAWWPRRCRARTAKRRSERPSGSLTGRCANSLSSWEI